MRKHVFSQRILPALLVALSLLLFRLPWIISPVVAAYGGIFHDATEITGSVSSIVWKYAKVNLSVTDDALDEIADGAFSPTDIYRTTRDLQETVRRLRGIRNQYDLSLLDDPDLTRILSFFTVYQAAFLIICCLGCVQILLYLFRGGRTRIQLFFFGNALLSAFFIAAEILLFRGIPMLKFHLSLWLFLSLFLSFPFRFWPWIGGKIGKLVGSLRTRIRKRPKKERRRAGRVVLGVVLIAGVIFFSDYYYAYVYTKTHERAYDPGVNGESEETASTSTDALYSDEEIKDTLRSYGFTDEKDLNRILRESYIIPGLLTTRTLSGNRTPSVCTSMTPQGVTAAGDYLLISAYCASGEHNSVVYVLNRSYHTFVKELVLPGHPHVGGITYDPVHEMVWVCDYQTKTKTAYVSAFPLSVIDNYSVLDDRRPISYTFSQPIYSMKRTSFLDYYDGRLYIGNFKQGEDSLSTVQTFSIDPQTGDIRSDNNDVAKILALGKKVTVPSGITLINGGIQGFTIDQSVTALSQSFGPVDSRLMVFRNAGTIMDYIRLSSMPDHTYTLPPMLEQITSSDGKLYLCFESASAAYRSRWNKKIDRILVLDL